MIRLRLHLFAFAACLIVPATAAAQTFPADSAWLPITRGGVVVGDPLGDASGQGARDIVGDETNGAAFVYGDASYLYFRLRVDDDPLQTANNYKPFGWGVEMDTDANSNNYEFLAMLDGIANPDEVALYQNTTPSNTGDPKDVGDTRLKAWPTDTHARSLQAPTTFGGNPDFFVDWAVDKADMTAAGVDFSKPIRFIFGTSNNANFLGSDLLSQSSETTIPNLESDPVNCNGAVCASCNAADACGETCAPCGGATPYCNGTACVECTSSAQCTAAEPICDTATGTCGTGCKVDADCKEPSKPACQAGGECVECTATNKTRCTGDRPVCDVQAGVCTVSCTTDADCKDPSKPACLDDGVCGECSPSNTKACTAGEVCDFVRGVCMNGCKVDADCKSPSAPACLASGVCGQCSTANTSLCTGITPVCDYVEGRCVPRCTTDTDCKDAARPACLPGAGFCAECSEANKKQCTAPATACNANLGLCVQPCTSDSSCTDPLLPACGANGVCGECSATNIKLCVATNTCEVGLGRCRAPGALSQPDGTATFDGSGITCAVSHGGGAELSALILAGLLLASSRRRRRS